MSAQHPAVDPQAGQAHTGSKVFQRVSDNTLLLLIGGAVILFHILTNGRYGFHRDELDILMNARHLDWGFISYPPFTPLVARIGLTLFGSSLIGLRLFSALAAGLVAVLVGLMARDFGGGRFGQVVAALAVAISPMALTAGMLIQYLSFDYLWWISLCFCLVRLLRTDDPRWWLGIGAAIGLGLETKYTIVYIVAGLVVGILLTRARRYLLSPWLWAGAGIAFLIFLPNLIWQISHDFASLDFLSAIHQRDIVWGRTSGFFTDQLHTANNPFMLPLWLAGLYFCLLAPAGKRFRPVAWMFLTTFALLALSRGRGYYVGPAYPVLVAAGAAWFDNWLQTRSQAAARVWKAGLAMLLLVGGVVAVLIVKPVVPINSPLWDVVVEISDTNSEMVGWPELVRQVAGIYEGLPADRQAETAILAGNYGEAGALQLYGPDYNLPPVISGANSLWERGYGDPAPQSLIVVGYDGPFARLYFSDCQQAGRVTNDYGVLNEETTHHNVLFLCGAPRQSWLETWPRLQIYQ